MDRYDPQDRPHGAPTPSDDPGVPSPTPQDAQGPPAVAPLPHLTKRELSELLAALTMRGLALSHLAAVPLGSPPSVPDSLDVVESLKTAVAEAIYVVEAIERSGRVVDGFVGTWGPIGGVADLQIGRFADGALPPDDGV